MAEVSETETRGRQETSNETFGKVTDHLTTVKCIPPEYSLKNPAIQKKTVFTGVSTLEFKGKCAAKINQANGSRSKLRNHPPSCGGFRVTQPVGKLSPTQVRSLVGSPKHTQIDDILRRSTMSSPRKYLPRIQHPRIGSHINKEFQIETSLSKAKRSSSYDSILGIQGSSLGKQDSKKLNEKRTTASVFAMPPEEYLEDLRSENTSNLWPRLDKHLRQLHFCRQLLSYTAEFATTTGIDTSCNNIANCTRQILEVDRVYVYFFNKENHLQCIETKKENKKVNALLHELALGAILKPDSWTIADESHPILQDQQRKYGISKPGNKVYNALSGPILNSAGEVLGVIQAVNKFAPKSEAGDAAKTLPNSSAASTVDLAEDKAATLEFSTDDAALLEIASRMACIVIERSNMLQRMKHKSEQATWMLEMLQSFSSKLDVNKAVECIIDCSYNILQCDRCSIYLVDKEANELVCHVSQDVKGIRIPLSTGIAGHVASTGETLNVPDVSKDPRFNPKVDLESGYSTKCILCQPIHNIEGEIVAVVQAVNKRCTFREAQKEESSPENDTEEGAVAFSEQASQEESKDGDTQVSPNKKKLSNVSISEHFTEEDGTLLHAIANQAGIALTNAHLYHIEQVARRKSDALVETSKLVSSELRLIPLMKLMVAEARNLIQADRGAVFLLDPKKDELWSVHVVGVAEELRFPSDSGIAGYVVQTGKPLRSDDAYSNPHFTQDFDVATDYRTNTVIAVPIKLNNGSIIGVVQMLNKRSEGGSDNCRFTDADVDFLEAFSSMAAVAITNAKLYEDLSHYGAYMGSVLQSLSSYVFTLNASGHLVICNREIREVLNVPEEYMRCHSYEEWIGKLSDNQQLAKDISLVFENGNPILVTDYALKLQRDVNNTNERKRKTVTNLPMEDSPNTKMVMMNYTVLPLEPSEDDSKSKGSMVSTKTRHSAPRKSLKVQFTEGVPSKVALDIGDEDRGSDSRLSSSPEVNGVIVILEPIEERDRMQYKLMRYKNRLSFVQSQLSLLKKKISVARLTPIQRIRDRMDELVRLALQLATSQMKRSATFDGNLLQQQSSSVLREEESDATEPTEHGTAAETTGTRKARKTTTLKGESDMQSFAHMLVEVKQLLHSPDLFKPAFQDEESTLSAAGFTETPVEQYRSPSNASEVKPDRPCRNEKPLFKRYSVLDLDDNELQQVNETHRFLRSTFGTEGMASETCEEDDTMLAHMISDIEHDENFALRSWDLDLLQYNTQQLVPLVLDMFADLALFQQFNLDPERMNRWIQAVRTNYKDNPFHNFYHAATVAHVSFLLVREPIMMERLHMADVLALLTAALCHDVNHPGVNNVFEVNSESPLAVLYNDKSVLENHHASLTFSILKQEDTAIFQHLPIKDQRYLRKMIVTSILHTDMAIHFELMSKFDTWVSQDFRYSESHNMNIACREDPEIRMLVTSTMLHCADLSNPVREYRVSRKWALNLNEEFKNQVKKEEALGLPLSEMMLNGDDMKAVAQREVNFLDFVVLPCWSTFEAFLPAVHPQVVQAQNNRERWMAEKDSAEETYC